MRPIKFRTTVVRPSDHGGWHFLTVPESVGSKFEKKDGTRRVVCTINGNASYQCALLPSSEGGFVVVVNKAMRTKLGISAGDKVLVELAVDESQYGLPMSEEFEEVLKQDPEGSKLFHSLTAGKQRSMIYYIGKVKDIDKRIHTALVFLEHLKKNGGSVIYENLQQELKRPLF